VALNADRAHVGGEVTLSGCCSDNRLSFEGARVKSSLRLAGAWLTGRGGLVARDTQVEGALEWTGITCQENTVLDLTNAHLGQLVDDEASWPKAGNLLLDGCVYRSLGPEALKVDARLEWLRRQEPRWSHPFSYDQLARALRRAGHDVDARRVLIEMQTARRSNPGMSRGGKLKNWLFEQSIRHGYDVRPALKMAVGFVLAGCVLFGGADGQHLMFRAKDGASTVPAAAATRAARTAPPRDYPSFSPLAYSVDAFLPVIDLHQEAYWLPRAGPCEVGSYRPTWCGSAVQLYLWLHIIVGWALTTLIVASFTGLVRKD